MVFSQNSIKKKKLPNGVILLLVLLPTVARA